jgi:diadenosine tetraphosphate (Ap4A) HIT family hydrolase
VGATASAKLLLHRNAALHWFILVPQTDVLDLLDLPEFERERLLHDASVISRFLKRRLKYPRVNIGALGLVVPQLHLHVIGRRENDPCWPSPVWGNLGGDAIYSPQQVEQLRGELCDN